MPDPAARCSARLAAAPGAPGADHAGLAQSRPRRPLHLVFGVSGRRRHRRDRAALSTSGLARFLSRRSVNRRRTKAGAGPTGAGIVVTCKNCRARRQRDVFPRIFRSTLYSAQLSGREHGSAARSQSVAPAAQGRCLTTSSSGRAAGVRVARPTSCQWCKGPTPDQTGTYANHGGGGTPHVVGVMMRRRGRNQMTPGNYPRRRARCRNLLGGACAGLASTRCETMSQARSGNVRPSEEG